MEWWKLAYWLIGTLGFAGTIALIVFAPGVAKIALDAVVRFFGFVLSYRIGCALVAAVLVFVATDYWRHSLDDADFAARVAAFEAAQDARDKRIAQETRDAVWHEIANATAENVTIDQEVKEFHDALPPVPFTGNPFRVGADAPRLCKIAGQAQCGPKAVNRGVSKARRRAADPGDYGRYRLPGVILRGFS
jgi:hypothetical protein